MKLRKFIVKIYDIENQNYRNYQTINILVIVSNCKNLILTTHTCNLLIHKKRTFTDITW